MEVEGLGTIIVKTTQDGPDNLTSQVLLEKLGGTKKLLAESKALTFVDLLKGDLDGDQNPEIVAVAHNRAGDDFLPFVFKGQSDLKQVFPPREEDNPIIGKEISIVPGKSGVNLCLKILVSFHDFGPPDLYLNEFYRLQGDKLEKTGERVIPGNHFNQLMNLAGMAFHKRDYTEALKGYQSIVQTLNPSIPGEAWAETHFFIAESKKWLKDFQGAIAEYKLAFQASPDSPRGGQARTEMEFLTRHASASQGLLAFVDVSLLEQQGKFSDALNLLEKQMSKVPGGPLDDYLLCLKGEILVSLGQVDEALKTFHLIKQKFPKSPIIEKVENSIQDLQSASDEME